MPHIPELRMTRQRQVILDELRSVTTHPTADEIYDMVRKTLPRISLGTVYRNLELMHEAGLVMKLETAGLQKRFDGNPDPHYHIRCVQCGIVRDVHFEGNGHELEAGLSTDFTILGHRLEFYGLCPTCQKWQTH
ncbi:MAG: Fur family transcriptional regulator [Thermodesulfobacteriota bacterium]